LPTSPSDKLYNQSSYQHSYAGKKNGNIAVHKKFQDGLPELFLELLASASVNIQKMNMTRC